MSSLKLKLTQLDTAIKSETDKEKRVKLLKTYVKWLKRLQDERT